MTKLFEGFSDYEKSGRPLVISTNGDIASHPGATYMGKSRVDGRSLYKLEPQLFYGDMPLSDQLGSDDIALVSHYEDHIAILTGE